MAIDYDPFSTASMRDPHPAYKEMRATGCPHFVAQRKAWALTLFDDVRKASLRNKWLDFTAGQTPGQLLLGEPVPHSFMTMNAPENRKWRALLEPYYTEEVVARETSRLQALIDKEFQPLIGRPEIDLYYDFGSKVMATNSAYNFGLSPEQAIAIRDLLEKVLLRRVPGQEGRSTPESQQAMAELGALLVEHVQEMRTDPAKQGPQGKVLVEADVDGHRLSDEELLYYLLNMMVVGAETTPMAVAGAFYYLDKHPQQKAMLLADHSLALPVYRETLRYDQPTNMLVRRAAMDFELNGAQVKKDDNLMFIYASANRDERRFPQADQFDITRENNGDLSFGVGAHYCLGAPLALLAGQLMMQAVLEAIDGYEIVEESCKRSFGEHIQGFTEVRMRPHWKQGQPLSARQ